MDERRSSTVGRVSFWLAWLLASYLAAYAGARAGHVLVRTGHFHGGKWIHCDVRGASTDSRHRMVEVAFQPLILVERTFWTTLGRHLKEPYGP